METKKTLDELQQAFKKHEIWTKEEIFQVLNNKWLEVHETEMKNQ